ncbi:MAG: hypothetical protein CL677_10270 [Bdellovibrionaceae bacterium]|nr:hypothetical protein [Pseudobdellovibrionaceae bacterium]|tara:strand:- start:172711 stop:172920 length:210 start_codon:yes stop_codon:yes gene_type:complete
MDFSDRQQLENLEELMHERADIINETISLNSNPDLKPRLRDRLRRLKLIRLMRIEKTLAKVRNTYRFRS